LRVVCCFFAFLFVCGACLPRLGLGWFYVGFFGDVVRLGLVYPDGFGQVFEVFVSGDDFALIYSGGSEHNSVE
jgi:hypothetical protein